MADSDMTWARLDPTYVPPEIDTTVPSVARVYDAILGSYLQLTHFCDESAEARANSGVLTRSLGRGQVRSRQEIARFFDGLDLVPPGVVFLPYWRPDVPVDSPPPAGSMLMLVGVSRKP
jgi:hypothetical protein